jgi:hypothetical protein
MTATAELLLNTANSIVRKTIVRARAQAMAGSLQDALSSLEREIQRHRDGTAPDVITLAMAKAELHYLNREEAEALAVFERDLSPRIDHLSETVRLVVEQNRATVKMSMRVTSVDAFGEYYHLVDQRKVAGFEWSDGLSIVAAQDAMDSGRASEALQPLWNEVVRTYRQGCWEARRWASARYAKLCLDLGDLDRALYHGVVGEAEKMIPLLAQAVVRTRDEGAVRAVVTRCRQAFNLRRHFSLAAELIATIHDVIPNDLIPDVAEWLLPRCRDATEYDLGRRVTPVAWKALGNIADRLPPDLVNSALDAAVTHKEWNAPITHGRALVDRDEIVAAVSCLIPRTSPGRLTTLSNDALPLALDRVQSHDYAEVINLLINIAHKGGEETKRRIADALYPHGARPNRILAQADHYFGLQSLSSDQLAELSAKVAGEIGLQVQRVKPGEQALRLPETVMTYGHLDGTGTIVTIEQGYGLAALLQHVRRLTAASKEELVRACLAAAKDEDNLPTNKQRLFDCLTDLAGHIDGALRDELFQDLLDACTAGMNAAPARRGDKLSKFNGFHGEDDDATASAMVCAAAYATGDEPKSARVSELIEEAAVSENAKLRRGAYWAARVLPDLSPEAVLPLLMGLRDPDPETAAEAFKSFAARPEWKMTRPNWRLLLLAARSAADSPSTVLRRSVALTISRRAKVVPSGLRTEWGSLLARLANDFASSVRKATMG